MKQMILVIMAVFFLAGCGGGGQSAANTPPTVAPETAVQQSNLVGTYSLQSYTFPLPNPNTVINNRLPGGSLTISNSTWSIIYSASPLDVTYSGTYALAYTDATSGTFSVSSSFGPISGTFMLLGNTLLIRYTSTPAALGITGEWDTFTKTN